MGLIFLLGAPGVPEHPSAGVRQGRGRRERPAAAGAGCSAALPALVQKLLHVVIAL